MNLGTRANVGTIAASLSSSSSDLAEDFVLGNSPVVYVDSNNVTNIMGRKALDPVARTANLIFSRNGHKRDKADWVDSTDDCDDLTDDPAQLPKDPSPIKQVSVEQPMLRWTSSKSIEYEADGVS